MKKMKPRRFPNQARVLQKLRTDSGLYLRDMKKHANINPTRWHRLENGYAEIKASEIMVINLVFNTDILKEIKDDYSPENVVLPCFDVSPFCA